MLNTAISTNDTTLQQYNLIKLTNSKERNFLCQKRIF